MARRLINILLILWITASCCGAGTDYNPNHEMPWDNNTLDKGSSSAAWRYYYQYGLYLKEKAAAPSNTAGFGHIWVKSTNPNRPWYRDGEDNDYEFALQNTSPTFTAATFNGTIIADGLTLGANDNITLGAQTLDHDGTDFVASDSLKVEGYLEISRSGFGRIIADPCTSTITVSAGSPGWDICFNAVDPCGVNYRACRVDGGTIGEARLIADIDGREPYLKYGLYIGTNIADSRLISASSTGAGSTTMYIGDSAIAVDGSSPSFAAATIPILTTATTADFESAVIWNGNSYTMSDADAPETVYDALIADGGMGTISTTNRRTLRLLPGDYVLGSKWELDTTFVDIKGLGATPYDTVVRYTGNDVGPAIEQTADDIRLSNFTISHDGDGSTVNLSSSGDHAFVVNVSSMTAPTSQLASVYRNMRFDHVTPSRNNNAISILGADDIEGRWYDCWGDSFSWNMIANKNLNGYFWKVDGDFGGFETGVEIGMEAHYCTGKFGGSTKHGCKINSNAKLYYCLNDSTIPAFAIAYPFEGYAYRCVSWAACSFAGTPPLATQEGDLVGTTEECVAAGGNSFGMDRDTGNSIQSGRIINCRNGSEGDYAAGRSGAYASTVTDNGTPDTIAIDPVGANNDITYTARGDGTNDYPVIVEYSSGGKAASINITISNAAANRLVYVRFGNGTTTAAQVTTTLDADDEAVKLMTWTAGGAGTIADDEDGNHELTGGVDEPYFWGNHPWRAASCVVDETVRPFDNGWTYTNEGTAQAITLTLPAAIVGYEYTFIDVDNTPGYDLTIDGNGAEEIGSLGTTAVADDDAYQILYIKCIVAGAWYVAYSTGTWD